MKKMSYVYRSFRENVKKSEINWNISFSRKRENVSMKRQKIKNYKKNQKLIEIFGFRENVKT